MTYAEEIARDMLDGEDYSVHTKDMILERVKQVERLVEKSGGKLVSRQIVATIIVSMPTFTPFVEPLTFDDEVKCAPPPLD